jgi:hypothetical protein
MWLSLLKKIRGKLLMVVADIYKGGVYKLNGDGYSPRSDRKHHIYLLESAYSISKNYRKRS